MNSASLRRLAADHASLHRYVLPPYYLHPAGATLADDLTQLTILLAGPSGTPYENGVWNIHLRIPHDYPRTAPKASFRTKIFHPNVDEATGVVCLDTLKRDWQPHLTLRDILITISCLLINPNPDSALNSAAGKLLQEDFEAFARKARLMTSIHASIPRDIAFAVVEAVNRGEDAKLDKDDESDYDENSESKENDPSISPSPVSPVKPIIRNSILGKRPLADLPIFTDAETDIRMTVSDLNVVANTPNLSNDMSGLSFKAENAWKTPTPRLSSGSFTFTAPAQRRFTFTGTGPSSTITSELVYTSSAKRQRTMEGKENEGEQGNPTRMFRSPLQSLPTSTTTARITPLGMTSGVLSSGVSAGSGSGPGMGLGLALGSRTTGPLLSSSKAKIKARVGLRRL